MHTPELDTPMHVAAEIDRRLRLPLHLKQMGTPENCGHRSGWKYVVDALRSLHHENGVLLDDFVERTFQRQASATAWMQPWVGIFHHPPRLPAWLDESAPPSVYIASPAFQKSLRFLMGAVALSEYLGQWLRKTLDVPVLVLKHPTEVPETLFSFERCNDSPTKRLVQIGWYARNYRGIYQVAVPTGYEKLHLLQDRPWVREAHSRTDRHSPFRGRASIGATRILPRLDDSGYDALLSSSVVFAEYFDVSASNTIIECIARNTPIVVNRHPAIEEYVGKSYPLFYTCISQVQAMLDDPRRILAAHHALRSLDKQWLDVQNFSTDILSFTKSCHGA